MGNKSLMKKDSPTLSSKPKSPSVISQARKYIFQKHVGAKNHRMCITSKKKWKQTEKNIAKKKFNVLLLCNYCSKYSLMAGV